MVDVLLIRAYLMRRTDGRTAGAVGALSGGSAATLILFLFFLVWPATAIGLIQSCSRPAALKMVEGLATVFGRAWLRGRSMEWTYVILFAIVFPIALSCGPPLLAAIAGRRAGRWFMRDRPPNGAGTDETTGRVGTPGDLGQRASQSSGS